MTNQGILSLRHAPLALLLLCAWPQVASADVLAGRWKLLAAEDLRADGSVARLPWGPRPVGAIVVEGGACAPRARPPSRHATTIAPSRRVVAITHLRVGRIIRSRNVLW